MSRVRCFSCHAAMPHFFHVHPPQLDLLDDSTEAVLHHHAHSSLRCVRAFVLSSSWNYNLGQQEVHDPPWKESGISINLQWYGNTTWRNEVWLPNKTSKSRSFHVHDRYMKRTTSLLLLTPSMHPKCPSFDAEQRGSHSCTSKRCRTTRRRLKWQAIHKVACRSFSTTSCISDVLQSLANSFKVIITWSGRVVTPTWGSS